MGEVRERICPRCGLRYSWVERRRVDDQVYIYAVHDTMVGDKRRIKKCYLGPVSYKYVTRLHEREGLVLRGLADSDRVMEYLDALIEYLSEAEIDRETALKLDGRFEEIVRRLRRYGERGEKESPIVEALKMLREALKKSSEKRKPG